MHVCSGVDALRAALAAHDDIEVIRGLCEGQKVPDELRKDLWKVCTSLVYLRRERIKQGHYPSPPPLYAGVSERLAAS